MCETYLHHLFSWNTLNGQARPFIVSFSIRKTKGDVPDCCCWRFVFLLSNLLKLKVTQRLHHVIDRFRFLSKCPIRGSDRKWRKTVAVPAKLCCFFYNVAFSFIPRSYTKLALVSACSPDSLVYLVAAGETLLGALSKHKELRFHLILELVKVTNVFWTLKKCI